MRWSNSQCAVFSFFALMLGFGLTGCGDGGDSKPTDINVNPTVNVVADAGINQYVSPGSRILLDGSATVSPIMQQNTTINYVWQILVKPEDSQSSLDNSDTTAPFFIPDIDGEYTFELTTSQGGQTDTKTVTVVASSGNSKPMVDAGKPRQTKPGYAITLDGSLSRDANGDVLSYAWVIKSQPAGGQATLEKEDTDQPTFNPNVAGDYTIELTVNDGLLDSDTDTITITVTEGNATPLASIGNNLFTQIGNAVTLDGNNSTDIEDGDGLQYQWFFSSLPADSTATLTNSTSVTPSFTPDQAGTYIVGLQVTDTQSASDVDSLIVFVTESNTLPVANAGLNQTTNLNVAVTLNGIDSYDENNDTLTYAWKFIGNLPAGSEATISQADQVKTTFTPDVAGDYVVQLITADAEGSSLPDSITVTATTINYAPVAEAGNDIITFKNTAVPLNGNNSTDQDSGDRLNYEWSITNQPEGSNPTLDNANNISTNFTADIVGLYTIELVVDDGTVDSQPDTLNITVQATPSPDNQAPVAAITAQTSIQTNEVINLDGSQSNDPNGDTLRHEWSITDKPDGSNPVLNNASSKSASFTADMTGTYTIQLIVNDGELNSEPKTVDITATTEPVDITPTANAGTVQTVIISSQVTLNGSQSTTNDGSDPRYAWTMTSKPTDSQAELGQATTETPTFIADLAGNYEISLTVTNGSGNIATAVVIVTATDNSSNKPPIADAGDPQSLPDNQLGTVNLDGSNSADPEGVTLLYRWQFVKKPEGSQATLTNATTGTPSFEPDEAGTYTIGLTVNDGAVDSKLDTTGVTVYLPVDEVEPNDASDQAQPFTKLGLGYPIKASMPAGSDQDWYRFEAEADKTYVVELFDVKTGLATTSGTSCKGWNIGLYLVVFDSETNAVERQCKPIGAGNVHNILTFKPTKTGMHYVQVASHAPTSEDSGSYKIRVLPQHSQASASWDAETFEPNNGLTTAYDIQLGADNALSSKFELRKTEFATNRADVDWYRFEAEANQTYVVELFDVKTGLATTSGTSCKGWNIGLYLVVFDSETNAVERQCEPVGAGNVHNILTFKPTKTGMHYVQVASHAPTSEDSGSYKIRALPQHSQASASWDAETFEPNNQWTTAYDIQLGADYALSSNFELRKTEFATNRADVDWYRFEAEASQTYVVELFDVKTSLAVTSGTGCKGWNIGLYLVVFDSETNAVERQCKPIGAGNVHNILTFKPTKTGMHYVQVASNSLTSEDSGSYKIRALPQHSQASASWDAETFEPNNQWTTAYDIQLGVDNALSSKFELHKTGFATNRADVDWYRFEAEAGTTYLIELYDIDSTLAVTSGPNCNGGWYIGIYLLLLDAAANDVVRQCSPVSEGNVHNLIEFTPEEAGLHYIGLGSNAATSDDNGNYSIRVIPQ